MSEDRGTTRGQGPTAVRVSGRCCHRDLQALRHLGARRKQAPLPRLPASSPPLPSDATSRLLRLLVPAALRVQRVVQHLLSRVRVIGGRSHEVQGPSISAT